MCGSDMLHARLTGLVIRQAALMAMLQQTYHVSLTQNCPSAGSKEWPCQTPYNRFTLPLGEHVTDRSTVKTKKSPSRADA